MKGSVVVFVVVVEQFVVVYLDYFGIFVVLFISDEEGDVIDGVCWVVDVFCVWGQGIDWCIIGELFFIVVFGDLLWVGCCGSLLVMLMVKGVQGYVVYFQKVCNLIYLVVVVVVELMVC